MSCSRSLCLCCARCVHRIAPPFRPCSHSPSRHFPRFKAFRPPARGPSHHVCIRIPQKAPSPLSTHPVAPSCSPSLSPFSPFHIVIIITITIVVLGLSRIVVVGKGINESSSHPLRMPARTPISLRTARTPPSFFALALARSGAACHFLAYPTPLAPFSHAKKKSPRLSPRFSAHALLVPKIHLPAQGLFHRPPTSLTPSKRSYYFARPQPLPSCAPPSPSPSILDIHLAFF